MNPFSGSRRSRARFDGCYYRRRFHTIDRSTRSCRWGTTLAAPDTAVVHAAEQAQFAFRWCSKQVSDIDVAASVLVLPRDLESGGRDMVAAAAAGVALQPELPRVPAQGRVGRQRDRRKMQMPSMGSAEEEETKNWNEELRGYPRAMHVVVLAAAVVVVDGAAQFRRMGCAAVLQLPFVVPVAAAVQAAYIAAGEVAAAGKEAVDCRYFRKEQELRPCR